VRIEPDKVTADKVTQALYHTANEDKIPLLLGLLAHMDPHRTIVFVNTKRAADKVWAYLEGNGIQAAVLSGDVPQTQRQNLLQKFQRGDLPVLVATDVRRAACTSPKSVTSSITICRRTPRITYTASAAPRAWVPAGDAISFACEQFVFSLPEIEAYIGHKIPVVPITEAMLAKPKPPVKTEHRPRPPLRGERGKPGQRAHGRSRPRS